MHRVSNCKCKSLFLHENFCKSLAVTSPLEKVDIIGRLLVPELPYKAREMVASGYLLGLAAM